MFENLDINHILSAALGGSGVSFLMRLLVRRVLAKFDATIEKLENITQRLVILETKLEALGILETNVARHERKLADLDARIRTRKPAGLHLSRGET